MKFSLTLKMTLNQILDKILSIKKITPEVDKIKIKILKLKKKYGGKTKVDNSKEILEKINKSD